MIIHSAEFVKSAVNPTQFPDFIVPEYAFIGRSNVGKSSLINMLTNRKLLAKTSSTPGKTRTLNFFNINKNWNLVDMPGYGYAKVSKKIKEEFPKIIFDYLSKRKSLIYTFVLIDSRHAPLDIDIKFLQNCAENQIPFVIIFTKADKLTTNQLKSQIDMYKTKLLEYFEELPLSFISSAESNLGRKEILEFIENQNNIYGSEIAKLKKL